MKKRQGQGSSSNWISIPSKYGIKIIWKYLADKLSWVIHRPVKKKLLQIYQNILYDIVADPVVRETAGSVSCSLT